MKKTYLSWVFCCFSTHLFTKDIAVTYELSKGRFGDQIVGYLHAKWVSYRYGIPILYKPFLYSEAFALHEREELWTKEKENSFERVIVYANDLSFSHSTSDSLLYVIPFFSDLEEDRRCHPDWSSLSIDWEDIGFRGLLRSLFSPRDPQLAHALSNGQMDLTVALHVRRGGEVDDQNAHFIWPMRFAPDSFYVECLRQLCQFYPNQPIYAHIFTDDLNPQKIAAEFQKNLAGLPIIFSYRECGDHPEAHVLDDFFAMMRFDCLVRSASNFTLVPALIGNYEIVMEPKHGYWRMGDRPYPEFTIDQTEVIKRPAIQK